MSALSFEKNRLDIIILVFFIIAGYWVATQFWQLDGQTQTAGIAQVYAGLAFFSLLALYMGRNTILGFIGIEKDGNTLLQLLGIGAIIGYLFTPNSILRAISVDITPDFPASIAPEVGLFYVVFVAVAVEEYFFRGFLLTTLEKIISEKIGFQMFPTIITIGVSSLVFIAWHLVAYQSNPQNFLPLFIFSVVQGVLTYQTQSLAPALGSHFVLNLINFRG